MVTTFVFALACAHPNPTADCTCPASNMACLIVAITTVNADGGAHTMICIDQE